MNKTTPPSSINQNLTTKLVQSSAWVYGRMIVTNIINLGVMAILARQLSPAEFGLVALAQVTLRLLIILGSQGVNEFVIYDNQDGREERLHAAFWLDLTLSIASALVGLSLLPLITRFYNEPSLAPILVAMLLRYPIDSLSKVPDALLKKQLDFQSLAIRDTFLDIFSSITSVIMALKGFGVWSLVVPGLLTSPLRAIIVLRMAHWHPCLNLYIKHWSRIFSYSANVIGSTITTYIVNEGDTLLIGKVLGTGPLGVYNLAWQTANLSSRNITGLINKMAMPALSAVANNTNRLWLGYSRMLRLLSIITFPLLVGLFVTADDFILTIYGSQWRDAILPLRILIIYAIRLAVGMPAGALFKAIGRPDINLKLGLAIVPFYLAAIWIGKNYGIVGVAAGLTIVRTISGLIGFELVARNMKQSFWTVIDPMIPALFASCLMGAFVWIFKILLGLLYPGEHIAVLVVLIGLGGLIYLFLLRTVYRNLAQELAQAIAPLSGRFQVVVVKVLRA